MQNTWNPITITEPTDEAICKIRLSHETMLISVLDAILQRYERDPAYPFIDTKLNLITGEDFTPEADATRDFKSKQVVYGWIQGRGLEALAGHAEWLPECSILSRDEKNNKIQRLHQMINTVLNTMETLRTKNHGRITFMMTPEGQPLDLSDKGVLQPLTLEPDIRAFGDLFYSKGLYAAARVLGLKTKADEAEAYFKDVTTRIEAGGFVTDQISFDPKNKVRPVPGRSRQGPHMIGLFGISQVAATGNKEWLDQGIRFIQHILDHHVIQNQHPELEPFDFVEAVDENKKPWIEDDKILCDPGHALECVGAMARFLNVAQDLNALPDALFSKCQHILPNVLIHVFRQAWNPAAGGICKTYDLVKRQPDNDDMPWWNLPETIRSAALLSHLFPNMTNATEVRQVLITCSNAFLSNYVNPDVHLMAYQTRNAQGQPIDVIPATPDADPGYHTGLAIIDFLRRLPQ